jgi:leucyl aminopeptidase (aminopeptidase T)
MSPAGMVIATDSENDELSAALTTALKRCLQVRAGEDLLVVSEASCADLADRVRLEGLRLGARASAVISSLRAQYEPPPSIAAALAACDVFFVVTDGSSISHTRARARASAAGARGVGVSADSGDAGPLCRLLAADLLAVAKRSDALAELLTQARSATITCPRGTALELDLTGRGGISDNGDFSAPGAYGNLPFGEAFVVPVGGTGRLVPATVAGMGRVGSDTVLEIDDGALVGGTGADGQALAEELRAHGAPGLNVAELGVGTNERARLSGSVVEDEKMLGSVHVAFGASAAIGGSVIADTHVDCVVPDVTLLLDGEPVVRDGILLLDTSVPAR